jgi:hypothetical protein
MMLVASSTKTQMKEKEMTTEIVKKRGRDRETNMEKEH